MQVTGIILAGGKSSRMGTEKGLQQLAGKSLISYAIEALTGICSEIIISASSGKYAELGLKVVADEFPDIGPMGGIFSCLKQSSTENNLVLSCDLPFVSEKLLSYLLENSTGFQAAIPWEGAQHYEPLCGFYRSSLLNKMNSYILKGNYKLPDLFEEISINKLNINNFDIFGENLFFNINSKHDLATAEILMSNRK